MAYDGKSIVDPLLKSAMTDYPNVPVQLEIFDKATGKNQTVSAQFVRFAHANAKTTPFQIRSSRNVFCEGTFSIRTFKMDFKVKCFDEKWKGKADVSNRKLVQSGGWYEMFPVGLLLERGGSYIKMQF